MFYILLHYAIIMSIGSVLFEHSTDNRKTIRSIESLNKKIINAKAALTFNKQCELNNLLPAFTNIHLNDEAVQQRQFTLEFRRNLVKHEIALKTDKVKELEDALSHKLQTYQTAVIHQDLRWRTDTVLSQRFEQHTCIQESRVQKKLCQLYGG